MLHLGDITKISGYTAPIVDVVVGGSPCQDLSVAGKRAGLDGERSGLFMEQLRIIKEMRERDRQNGRTDEHIRPRYKVWENVPGAFSSNKSEDFRIVLEETAKVCGKDAVIPMPDKGKWTTSGCILGDGWSIAWRVLDAQFYGVPQRRRRIALVADFGGHSAPEILFIRKNVSRDTQPSQPQASDASRGTGADDIYCIDGDKLNKKERKGGSGIGYREGDKQYTLTAKDVHGVAYCFEPGAAKRLGGYVWEDLAPTLRTEVGDNRPSVAYTMQDREGKAGGGKGALIAEELSANLRAGFAQTLFQPIQCIDQGGGKSACNAQEGTGGGNVPMVMTGAVGADLYNQTLTGDKSATLSSNSCITATRNGPTVVECFSKSKRAQTDTDYETWQAPTLTCTHGGEPAVCYWDGGQVAGTLTANNASGCQRMPDKENFNCVIQESAVCQDAIGVDSYNLCETGEQAHTLTASKADNEHIPLVVALDRASFNQGKNALYDFEVSDKGINSPLVAKGPSAVAYTKAYGFDQGATRDVGSLFLEEQSKTLTNGSCPGHHNGVVVAVDCRNALESDVNGALQSNMAHSLNGNNVVRTRYIVRRLTPLECERLQGYPDGWTDIGEWTDSKGKVHKTSDAARYKALGNSIALPPWKWVLKRLCACYERDATLASLFDGIGGFPKIWEDLNGKGTCLWASEIEEFPIAVTKKRIGG